MTVETTQQRKHNIVDDLVWNMPEAFFLEHKSAIENIKNELSSLKDMVSFSEENETQQQENKTKEELKKFLLSDKLWFLSLNMSNIASLWLNMSAEWIQKIIKAQKIIKNWTDVNDVKSKLTQEGFVLSDTTNQTIGDNQEQTEDSTNTDETNREQNIEQNNWTEVFIWNRLLLINKVKDNRQAFWEKVIKISKNLNINPNWLMWIMNKESGLNHKARNKNTKATWLIQFMPRTAENLGTTIDQLKNMSNIEQLDYVEKFYLPKKDKINSYINLYLSTFYPVAVWKPQNFVLWSERSQARAESIGRQNNMNNGNPITKRDVERRISKWIPQEYRSQFA